VPFITSRIRSALGKRVLRTLGYDVSQVAVGAVLVTKSPKPGGRKTRIVRVSPGAALVHSPALSRRHWMDQEKALGKYLVAQHIAGILRKYKVNCVLDVGANRGQYARALRRFGYKGYIVSFEPVPEDFAALASAAADDPKWTVHQMALGRADGVLPMHVTPGTMSSLLPPSEFGSARYERFHNITTMEVQVRRLDELLDSITSHVADPRLYLKLDTQGYDLEVFGGLTDRVREFVGMQSEVAFMKIYDGMPRMPEALEVYEGAGFEVTALYPVSREARTARVLEFDCVMVRADAVPAATTQSAADRTAAGGEHRSTSGVGPDLPE
jgi:FkbM family methyltransferase